MKIVAKAKKVKSKSIYLKELYFMFQKKELPEKR